MFIATGYCVVSVNHYQVQPFLLQMLGYFFTHRYGGNGMTWDIFCLASIQIGVFCLFVVCVCCGVQIVAI